MLNNYLKIAVRNILRNKLYSFINIIGLAVGIASCIMIVLYIAGELSYDKFNRNADSIYRVHFEALYNGNKVDVATSPMPLGPTLARDYPEVVNYTRIRKEQNVLVQYGNKSFSEKKFYWVDSSFFDIFTTRFVHGNPKTALARPNTIVITESVGQKYFGNENPLGKILHVSGRGEDYLISGVVEDFPQNSHFHFDFLAPLSSFGESRSPWQSNPCYTYVLLRRGVDPGTFQRKLRHVVKDYLWAAIKASTNLGLTFEQFEAAGNSASYVLQPLTSIHLHSHLDYELEPNSDISYVYIFATTALAVLLLAIINFMNLATGRSERRGKEVGIRKTLGSTRPQIARQFITESILMSSIAVLVAVGMVELFLPLFERIAGKEMSFNPLGSVYTILLLVCFSIIVGLLAGSYPSVRFSSIRPTWILGTGNRLASGRSILRDILVVFQFTVSIVLIIGTLLVYRQLSFIQGKNLGFNKEEMVVIKNAGDLDGGQVEAFKQELLKDPGVVNVTASSCPLGLGSSGLGNDTFVPVGKSVANGSKQVWILYGDYDLVNTYQLKMVQGRYFEKKQGSDASAVVLNESAVKAFGMKNAVGKKIVMLAANPKYNKTLKIVGVVKDFNFESLHQPVHPLAVLLSANGEATNYISVRIAPGNVSGTMASLGTTWHKFEGGQPFDRTFLDRDLLNLYHAEQTTGRIAVVFSSLAILVACLGLLGLAGFITEQRTKEIGIRKILGASVPEIVVMLSKQFTIWVLVANAIAWPLAYCVMKNWLDDFAYRTNMSWWIFAASGLLAVVIAIITVSVHAVKAATANPVESLRYE